MRERRVLRFGAVVDDTLGDEVRITVIAAGFDRFEGEHRPSSLRTTGELGLRDDETLVGTELSLGDDDFDVPEFLR